jgi:FixJ family two-component response regulator
VTAQPTDLNAERALAEGATAFIEKPFEMEAVLAAVRGALGD